MGIRTLIVVRIGLLVFSAGMISYGFWVKKSFVISRTYIGAPAFDYEWGYLKISNSCILNELRLSSGDQQIDNSAVVDMSINGLYQGINLTIPAGASDGEITKLSMKLLEGDEIKFKFIKVTLPSGCNFTLDLLLHTKRNVWIYVGTILPLFINIISYVFNVKKKSTTTP